jgi:hypothetical protein
MNRQVLQLHIDRQAEQQAADAEEQSDHQKGMSVHAEKFTLSSNPAASGWLRLRPRVPCA